MSTQIKCGKCKSYHATVTLVKACYANPAVTSLFAQMKEKPAVTIVNTPASGPFVPAHRKAPGWKAPQPEFKNPEIAAAAAELAMDTTNFVQAPVLMAAIQEMAAAAPVLKGQDLEVDKLYKLGDEVFKVIWNKYKTYKYAMKLHFTDYGMKKGKFIYAASVINQLDSTMKMDLAGAQGYAEWAFKKFNIGVCCNCGKLLTDPNSVAKGIGPICIKKFS